MNGVLGMVSVVLVDAQCAVRGGVGCDSQTSACGCGGGSAEFAPERVGCLSHSLRMTAAVGTTISMRGRCVCMRLCVCFCYCSLDHVCVFVTFLWIVLAHARSIVATDRLHSC